MRIKSYFDSSVQTAMRQARGEFGDDVMLVTSRMTSPESRHLGDYEVVFAVDENETGPKAAMPGFEQIFREQLAPAKPVPARPAEGGSETAVDRLQALLTEIGLDASLSQALMALVQACASRQARFAAIPAPAPVVEIIETAILPAPAEEPMPVLSAETAGEIAPAVQEEEPQAIVEPVPAPAAPVIPAAPVRGYREPFQRNPALRGTVRPPAKSGLMLMMASLGLFAISRRSGR